MLFLQNSRNIHFLSIFKKKGKNSALNTDSVHHRYILCFARVNRVNIVRHLWKRRMIFTSKATRLKAEQTSIYTSWLSGVGSALTLKEMYHMFV